MMGNSVDAPGCGSFVVNVTETVKRVTNRMVPQEKIVTLSNKKRDTYPTGNEVWCMRGKDKLCAICKKTSF